MFKSFQNPSLFTAERLQGETQPLPVVRFRGIDPNSALSHEMRLRYAAPIAGLLRSVHQNSDISMLPQFAKRFDLPWGRVRYMRQGRQEYVEIDVPGVSGAAAAAVEDIYDHLYVGSMGLGATCYGYTYDAVQEAATGFAGLQYAGEEESDFSFTLSIGGVSFAGTSRGNLSRSAALDVTVFGSDDFREIDYLLPSYDNDEYGPIRPPPPGPRYNTWFPFVRKDELDAVFGGARSVTTVNDETYNGPPTNTIPGFPYVWDQTIGHKLRSVQTTVGAIGLDLVHGVVDVAVTGSVTGQVLTPSNPWDSTYTVNDQWAMGANFSTAWPLQSLSFFRERVTTWRGATTEREVWHSADPYRLIQTAIAAPPAGASVAVQGTAEMRYTHYSRRQLLVIGADEQLGGTDFTLVRSFA